MKPDPIKQLLFRFFMTFAINIIDEYSLSNDELLSKYY